MNTVKVFSHLLTCSWCRRSICVFIGEDKTWTRIAGWTACPDCAPRALETLRRV